MSTVLRTLTEHDIALLKEIVQYYRHRRINTPIRSTSLEDSITTPEVYIAWIANGITGIGSTTGTGTGTGVDDPSSEMARIFRLNRETDELVDALFEKEVYNLSHVAIPPRSWRIVQRDKFGIWWVVPVEVSTSFSGTTLTITTVDGTPSYANTNTIRFDEADGFSLSQPAAGIARVDMLPAGVSRTVS